MTCDHCERSVTKALQSVSGVSEVLEVGHADAEARDLAGPEATADRIERAVAQAGYGAHAEKQTQGADVRAAIRMTGGANDLLIVGGVSARFAAAVIAAD